MRGVEKRSSHRSHEAESSLTESVVDYHLELFRFNGSITFIISKQSSKKYGMLYIASIFKTFESYF